MENKECSNRPEKSSVDIKKTMQVGKKSIEKTKGMGNR